jgi:hypothetical protein
MIKNTDAALACRVHKIHPQLKSQQMFATHYHRSLIECLISVEIDISITQRGMSDYSVNTTFKLMG